MDSIKLQPLNTINGPRNALAVITAALLAILIASGSAQQTSSQHPGGVNIIGAVLSREGNPVNEAVVRLEQKGGSGTVEAKTNAEGAFTFSNLLVGSYLLSAEKTGLHSSVSVIVATSRGDQKKVELTLTATGSASSDPSAQAMEFADKPNFTVAGVTDWTAVGGHGSDSSLRTSEALAIETLRLEPESLGPKATNAENNKDKSNESESTLRTALRGSPSSFEANQHLGSFYLRIGNYREAIALLQSAYQIDPTNRDNVNDLALAYERSGDASLAREHIHELLAHQESADLHRLTGDLDEKLGDPLAAVHEYQQAVHLDPSEQNYFEWGSELLLHRAVWQAQEVFRKGAEAHPKSARMQTGLGAALFSGALYDEAALHLCRASDLNPSAAEPYVFMGKMQVVAPNPLDCVQSKLAQFVQQQPENSLAYYFYAMAILKQHEKSIDKQASDEAESLLTKAVTLDAKCGDAYLQLGIISSSRHDPEKAISFYKKAVEANPQLGDAHYRLAVAYDRIGEPSKAKEEFQLHDKIEKTQAVDIERQRRMVKQFLVLLPEQPTPPAAK